jgi:capsid protein
VKKYIQKAIDKIWYATHSGHPSQTPVISVDDMQPMAYAGQTSPSSYEHSIYDGGKFYGGFGATQLFDTDYWTLRARSAQLFKENLYARGLIRRLVTNEINTGLTPELCPDEEIIGLPEDSLNDWTETVENRFNIWSKNPNLCDFKRQKTFGALQRIAKREAYIEGDILVVLHQSQRYRLPAVQLIPGSLVRTPMMATSIKLKPGHEIKHGVELNALGRVVAHWVTQKDGTSKRVAAYGEKSGRKLSWLVYGCDKRMDEVRGEPLLSIVLQSLKEIDRYRDSAQRKAVVNSILAMYIKKSQDKMGSLPITGSAVRKDSTTVNDSDGEQRTYNIANQIPGVVVEELQHGEEPVGFSSQGTDVNFQVFEEAIIAAVAWANETPPEILKLAFSNNYSASQAAINEFKIYINQKWSEWGEEFCTPIQIDWLISEVLLQKIKANGLVEAWRDPSKYDVFGAWTSVEWYGSIKPSTDMFKQTKGSKMLVDEGWSTNAREARVTTGTKYSKNIKRLKRENELKVEAMRPLMEFKAEFGVDLSDNSDTNDTELEAKIDEYLAEKESFDDVG